MSGQQLMALLKKAIINPNGTIKKDLVSRGRKSQVTLAQVNQQKGIDQSNFH